MPPAASRFSSAAMPGSRRRAGSSPPLPSEGERRSTWARRASAGTRSRSPTPMDTARDAGRLGGSAGSVRGQCRQSARRLLRRRCRSGRSGAARPADRARPALPRAGQRQCRVDRGRRDPAAGLGARRRPHPGLRHRRLRDRGRGDQPQARLEPGRGPPARRRAAHRLGAGRHDRDDAARPTHVFEGEIDLEALRERPESSPSAAGSTPPRARRCGCSPRGEDDLVIVNSCAVTNEAVRQTRQAIRRAKRARPDARIVVTGCAAQIEPETFAAMPEVARVLGNREKFDPLAWLEADERVRVSDIMAVRETAPHLVTGFAERSRAFVEVQNGCDHRCTFCIIPYGRGNSRSVPAGLVVEKIKRAGRRGLPRSGADRRRRDQLRPRPAGRADARPCWSSGSFATCPTCRGCACPRSTASRSTIGWWRSSPASRASCRTSIWLPGRRRHDPEADEAPPQPRRRGRDGARLKAKRPEIAIGADLIAGFPTETEAMAANSLRLVDECDIVMGHIFPFSPKQGTPAARMPQVPRAGRQGAGAAAARGDARGARRCGWRAWSARAQQVLVEREDGTRPRREFRASRACRHSRSRIRSDSRSSSNGGDDVAKSRRITAVDGEHPGRNARMSEETPWLERLRGGLPEDLGPARRQSHRPVHQGRARRRDARRDRGGADRVRPRPRHRRADPRAPRRASGSSAASASRRCARSSPRRSRRCSRRSPSRSRSTPFRARR